MPRSANISVYGRGGGGRGGGGGPKIRRGADTLQNIDLTPAEADADNASPVGGDDVVVLQSTKSTLFSAGIGKGPGHGPAVVARMADDEPIPSDLDSIDQGDDVLPMDEVRRKRDEQRALRDARKAKKIGASTNDAATADDVKEKGAPQRKETFPQGKSPKEIYEEDLKSGRIFTSWEQWAKVNQDLWSREEEREGTAMRTMSAWERRHRESVIAPFPKYISSTALLMRAQRADWAAVQARAAVVTATTTATSSNNEENTKAKVSGQTHGADLPGGSVAAASMRLQQQEEVAVMAYGTAISRVVHEMTGGALSKEQKRTQRAKRDREDADASPDAASPVDPDSGKPFHSSTYRDRAAQVALPAELTEARNYIAHGRSPTLPQLRFAAALGLSYLKTTFWDAQATGLRHIVQEKEDAAAAAEKAIDDAARRRVATELKIRERQAVKDQKAAVKAKKEAAEQKAVDKKRGAEGKAPLEKAGPLPAAAVAAAMAGRATAGTAENEVLIFNAMGEIVGRKKVAAEQAADAPVKAAVPAKKLSLAEMREKISGITGSAPKTAAKTPTPEPEPEPEVADPGAPVEETFAVDSSDDEDDLAPEERRRRRLAAVTAWC